MSDSQEQPWSDNPNAPMIPLITYHNEKAWFAGTLASFILYGILIILFSNCMTALFNPVHRRGEGIKWGLVSYTVVMFSLVTVYTATKGHIFSISYIDNRGFPRGPWGYQADTYLTAIPIVSRAAFNLNNWSADGLLLYRCYLFYSMNLWVIAFPFLMYLASVGMGILAIFSGLVTDQLRINLTYFSISLSLNILLTVMIVVRLVLRSRNIRTAMGCPAGISGLYKTTATMLIESSALFAVCSLLVIIPWAVHSPVANAFTRILAETQVIASLLIVQRVANKSALTSNTIAPAGVSSPKVWSRGELTDDSSSLPGGRPISSVDKHGTISGELVVGVETVLNIHRDKV